MGPFLSRSALLAATAASMLIGAASSAPSATASTLDGAWIGTLRCTSSGKPWSSSRTARMHEGMLFYVQGKDGQDGFETWQGLVDPDGEIMIYGRYRWKVEKYVWMKGRIKGGTLKAAGQRGPRRCSLLMKHGRAG